MSARDASVAELVIGAAVVIVALLTLLVPRRLASVVSFLVFGVLLSVLWALAGAPDVALAEAALGTGVTGVLFIDAVTRTRTASRQDAGDPPIADDDTAPSRRASPTTVLSLAATVGVTVLLTVGLAPALWRAASPLDGASPGLTDAVARVLPETGVEHAVTGVLLNLRSYDTLMEVVVLLVAVLAALAIGTESSDLASGAPTRPAPALGGVPHLQSAATAVLTPVLVLLAAWLLFAGSSRPGGAFQAGAVLAALVLLLHLGQRPALTLGSPLARWVSVAGVLAFVLVAAVGPLLGGAWLELDDTWAGPVIVVLESFLALTIGASLALIAISLRRGPAR